MLRHVDSGPLIVLRAILPQRSRSTWRLRRLLVPGLVAFDHHCRHQFLHRLGQTALSDHDRPALRADQVHGAAREGRDGTAVHARVTAGAAAPARALPVGLVLAAVWRQGEALRRA